MKLNPWVKLVVILDDLIMAKTRLLIIIASTRLEIYGYAKSIAEDRQVLHFSRWGLIFPCQVYSDFAVGFVVGPISSFQVEMLLYNHANSDPTKQHLICFDIVYICCEDIPFHPLVFLHLCCDKFAFYINYQDIQYLHCLV